MSGAGPIPLEEAFRLLDGALAGTRLPAQILPSREAAGRVLAREARSALDLPPFDKAAVDGYALPAGASGGTYRVVATVAAGQPPPPPLGPGETAHVMTGAPVPPGTGEVVMQEDTEREGDLVRIRRRGAPNLCLRGEDARRGDVVCPAGRRLREVDVANLVSCGVETVEAVRRPRIAALATGDEIVEDPARLEPGKIMDANGPLLAALCARWGMDLVMRARVPDDPGALERSVREGMAAAEIVVLTGGVSEGKFDYVPAILERVGLRTHFTRVACKPGRPMTFASGGGRFVFGLPGNPVSVFLTFHLYVLRAAARLAGAEPFLRAVALPLGRPFRRRRGDRLEYVPARLSPEGRVEEVPCHGSAHLLALAGAEGFFSVPRGTLEVAAGAPVEFLQIP